MVFQDITGLEKELVSQLVLESDFMISLALEVSTLGSTVFAAIVVAGLWYLGDRETAEKLFFSLAAVKVLVYGMKILISRPRPPEAVMTSFTPAFPSGHAATAFLMASILSARYQDLEKYFFGLAALVASTRVLLGFHYPTDVLAGAFIGLVAGYLVNKGVPDFKEYRP